MAQVRQRTAALPHTCARLATRQQGIEATKEYTIGFEAFASKKFLKRDRVHPVPFCMENHHLKWSTALLGQLVDIPDLQGAEAFTEWV